MRHASVRHEQSCRIQLQDIKAENSTCRYLKTRTSSVWDQEVRLAVGARLRVTTLGKLFTPTMCRSPTGKGHLLFV